ncbi:DUF802 domain-containing protein [Noviherbaspirillum galbum]|uniref:DUF802 domain-containing protein n=1 Tax=Noviherbaspirillum galbum TaxID=2709383 RepID=A0A6B3SU19_9BURK|nr:DUF802 domain-containing protein [Noviherbaspirillum galbum]NEX64174.1 DUF802 domain-containing protein [Noviherbaspirillum galbum]
MNKHLFAIAFLLGLIAIVWAGVGFIDSSWLAMSMTAIIGAAYVAGAIELHHFRQATRTLNEALAAIPASLADLNDWLPRLQESLQNPVRLRIEGERGALPGPALTPYLVGLLVMLGMLGTFLGMVVTLKGAVFALEKTTDLQAIRSALSVPVKGLGLAFGTSVAGVAASAMLGLMAALSRRDRLQASQLLDTKVATVLRRFSFAHQRQETFKALQLQSQALPAVVDKLQAMMTQMDGMTQHLSQRLLGNQEEFHRHVKLAYTELAGSVDQSLRDSMKHSAQVAGESIKPVITATMQGIADDAARMHERMAGAVQAQLDGLSARFSESAHAVSAGWTAALKDQEASNANFVGNVAKTLDEFAINFERRSGALVETVADAHARLHAAQAEQDGRRLAAWTGSLDGMAASMREVLQQAGAETLERQRQICDALAQSVQAIQGQAQDSAGQALAETSRLIASAEALMQSRMEAEAAWLARHHDSMEQLAALLRSELGALKEDEAARGQAAVDRLAALQDAVTVHLGTLGTALEAPIARLIETASEAPRAAADVISQLRQEVSKGMERDNALLEERSRIMETLNALLDAINHASREQRAAIDSLVASSATALNATSSAFTESVALEAGKLSDIAAQVSTSAIDVASLGETLGAAVQSFHAANEKLVADLQRIEAALDKSMARSDDQLAYYVAQAREIIDLSLSSQRDVVEELRRLPSKQALVAEEAR